MGTTPDDKVLEMTKTKQTKIIEAFEIGGEELKTVTKNGDSETAIVNLVIEHVALLSTQFWLEHFFFDNSQNVRWLQQRQAS